MKLEQSNRNGAPANTKTKLEEIRQHYAEIAGDVRERLEIESQPGFGTQVVAVVPVPASKGERSVEAESASAGAA